MTDTATTQAPKPDRFGFTFGIASSKRRADIAAAQAEGESFDGLTDRDVALMAERGAHAIMAAQTVRGRFLGDVNEVFVTALYMAGTAASEDVVRLFDAIAERKVDLRDLLRQVRDYLKEVEAERRKDEEERRAADVASHARILAEMTKGEETDPDSGAHPVVAGHGGRQAAGAARPSIEPR